MGLNRNDKKKFDMYRINLKNGAAELDTENPGLVTGWVADADFKIRPQMAEKVEISAAEAVPTTSTTASARCVAANVSSRSRRSRSI